MNLPIQNSISGVATSGESHALNASADNQFKTIFDFNEEILPASQKVVLQRSVTVRGEMLMISRDDIRVKEGFNPRIQDAAYHAHIRALADSMKAEGYFLDKPIAVYAGYDGKRPVLFAFDGFCRLAAYDLALSEGAPLQDLPIVIKPNSVTIEDLTVGFVVGNTGKRLTPMEIGVVCKRLVGFGWSEERIAERLHISCEYVAQLLLLAGAPRFIRDFVQNGEMTASLAVESLRKHGADVQDVLVDALANAKAAGKTRLTKRFMPGHGQRKFLTKKAPVMLEAIERLTKHDAFKKLPNDLRITFEALVSGAAAACDPVTGDDVAILQAKSLDTGLNEKGVFEHTKP